MKDDDQILFYNKSMLVSAVSARFIFAKVKNNKGLHENIKAGTFP